MQRYKLFVFNFLVNRQHRQILFPQHKVDTSENHILPPPCKTSDHCWQYDRLVNSLGHYRHTNMLFPHYDYGVLPLGSRCIPTSIRYHTFFYLKYFKWHKNKLAQKIAFNLTQNKIKFFKK